MKIEIRRVVAYRDEDAQSAENAVLGDRVEETGNDLDEYAVCAVIDGEARALGIFLGGQAEVCRDMLLKLFPPDAAAAPLVFIAPCQHDRRTGRHELYDGDDAMVCEWAVFRSSLYARPEIVEIFATHIGAIEALGAVQRYCNLITYSLAEMRAALQMLQWAQIAMFGEEKPLLALAQRVGHQAFRDIFVRLAPIHAEAQAHGMRENGITDYTRSHDNTWTACFFAFLADVTETGIEVKPDWRERAVDLWARFKEEMEKGIHPDFKKS